MPANAMNASPDNARQSEKRDFLARTGWASAAHAPIAGDASTRSYERLSLDGRNAILMNAPRGAETAACPPGASAEDRRKLGYNAMARLAGPNLNAFLAVADALRSTGLSAPEIYAADAATGFALIEDLGDELYARAIPRGEPETDLYAAAIDALIQLRVGAQAAPRLGDYVMQDYDSVALAAETDLVIDWYWPHLRGEAAPHDIRSEYAAAWDPVIKAVSRPSSLVLRDYHAENLLWLPARDGYRRAGVIDFQDGLFGNPAYDLVSLLEDARRDVSADLAQSMIARYAAGARRLGDFDAPAFEQDYAILGAQRNAKILGIFARLINRDGKRKYAEFFPRVEAHFRNDIASPALWPVREFFKRYFGDRF